MKIKNETYQKMIAHARAGYPNEACGLLASPTPGEGHIFYPMKNLDESSISYFMDPKEQLKIFKELREKKWEVSGIFHSHVASAAYPSQKDIRLAFYPDIPYLIVSLSDPKNPQLRAFWIREEKVTEEAIALV